MDWIHENNETFCDKSYAKLILKEVNVWRSDSSAISQSLDSLDRSVESLSISETFSGQIPNHLFESFDNLKHLNLSNNNLTNFNSNSLLSPISRLVSLDLSSNQLKSIQISGLNGLEALLLSNNRLNSIQPFDGKLQNMSLENNDWICDNELLWLLRYASSQSLHIVNRTQTRCEGPESAKGMTFAQWLSVLETPVCRECECSVLRKVMSVNCSDRHLDALPSSLPSITKIVRLENNAIKNISLGLSGLSAWRNVSYLNLNNNTIESFDGLERSSLLKGLVALNMSANRLTEIPVYILDQLSHLDELYLADNPWRCDCKTVVFQAWLQRHFKNVKDVYNIRCAASDQHLPSRADFNDQFSNRDLLRIPRSELCPQSRDPIDYLGVIIWMLSSLILIIIVKLIYDYFWQKRTGKLPEFFKLNLH